MDRYQVEQLINPGREAWVFGGHDERTGQPIIVKVHVADEEDAHSRRRFSRERDAYRLLNHRLLPHLLHSGKLGDGHPYIVLDALPGQTLARRLHRGPLAAPAVVELGRMLCRALHAVHVKGLVHSDITPGNLILGEGPNPTIRLIDFGICVRTDTGMCATLGMHDVYGTPAYMAPEQAMGERLDARADVYSTCAVLYEALCGVPPFTGATAVATLTSVLRDVVVPPSVRGAECPIEFERILMRGLCRDRSYRYRTARRLEDELCFVQNLHTLPRGRAAWSTQSSLRAVRTDPESATIPIPRN